MGWLLKTGASIFGGGPSMIFAGIMLVSLLTLGYNWKQSYDGKITARANAIHTQAELERATQARDIYSQEVSKMMDNRKKDEQAIAQLKTFSETQEALINEALKELDKTGGSWANSPAPTNRQRMLFLTFEELEASTNLPADGEGTPTGRVTPAVSDDFLRKLKEATTKR